MHQRFYKSIFTLMVAASLSLAAAPPASASDVGAEAPAGKRLLNIAPFDTAIQSLNPERVAKLDQMVITATIPQLQGLFQQNKLTSEELATYYLWRIQHFDVDKLNSVTELNPDALEIAKALDGERKAGKVRGPLHGTAVLLIDLIGTGDKMHTTAGALALADAKSDRDAFVVKRLRDAGVVILGKTSLTEWSGFIAYNQKQGYSTLGGQVLDPYGSKLDPSGSSTGSAVAAAANFATFTLGEETFGALTLPAVSNSVVTLKPSVGLISRDRLIPNLPAHDTIGPMTRNTTDLALVTEVLIAVDRNDPTTNAAAQFDKKIVSTLNADGLRGKRVGVLPPASADDKAINDQMIEALKTAGADVVPLPTQLNLVPDIFAELDPINAYGFKTGVEKYLKATHAPIKTFKDIVAFNDQDPKVRVQYGQEYLQMAATLTMTQRQYDQGLQALTARMKTHIDGLLAENKLDFIAGTNLVLPFSIYYAAPGYPAVAIPIGYRTDGTPIGFVLTAKRFDDAKLIRAAYTLEQATHAWQPPNLANWQ